MVEREFTRLFPLSSLVVPLILLFYFRSVIPALLSIVPLAFGVSVGLCILKIFGGYIELTTPLALALIFGTGIDDFIAVYHAFRRGGISGVIKLFRPTFLTSFTTAAAGIGLLFSYFEQSRFFGLFLAVSMMSVWFANLFLVPTILVMMKQMKIK
jgi:predicted RND superfamily exporter protein